MTIYAKSILSILAAAFIALAAALTDNTVTANEAINVGIAVVTAIGVYAIPNLPAGPGHVAKLIVAFAGAGLAALVTIVTGATGFTEVTASDWLTVIVAALAAVGVGIVPNIAKRETPLTVVNNIDNGPSTQELQEAKATAIDALAVASDAQVRADHAYVTAQQARNS